MSTGLGTPVSPVACARQGTRYLPGGHAAAPQPPKGTRAGTLPLRNRSPARACWRPPPAVVPRPVVAGPEAEGLGPGLPPGGDALGSALAPHQARQRARVGPWASCDRIAPLSARQRPSRACPIKVLQGPSDPGPDRYRVPPMGQPGAAGQPVPARTTPI
jgi:hypothetical protein